MSILRRFKKNKILDEDLFCNYMRSNKQQKLISLIKKKKIDIGNYDLNWQYISENDDLSIEFIEYFKNYIDFNKLSLNKNLTTSHITKFAHSLNWIDLSKTYSFTINELHMFNKFIRWEYLFFYNNNPSNDLKIFFKEKMWWLFLDDNLSIDVSKKYHIYNNKILNSNTKQFPPELIDIFNLKLDEYKNNLNILKLILKKQLFKLYDTYEKKEVVKNLTDIKCDSLYTEIRKDLNIKENNVKCQTEIKNTNELGTQSTYETKEIAVQTENEIIEEIIDINHEEYERINSEENKEIKMETLSPTPTLSPSLRVQVTESLSKEEEDFRVSINLQQDFCGNN